MNKDLEKIYLKCFAKWGEQSQINVWIEELSELIKVLAKWNRKINGSNIYELIDEIADVEICIEQIKTIYLYYDSTKLRARKTKKINRLIEMLDK